MIAAFSPLARINWAGSCQLPGKGLMILRVEPNPAHLWILFTMGPEQGRPRAPSCRGPFPLCSLTPRRSSGLWWQLVVRDQQASQHKGSLCQILSPPTSIPAFDLRSLHTSSEFLKPFLKPLAVRTGILWKALQPPGEP